MDLLFLLLGLLIGAALGVGGAVLLRRRTAATADPTAVPVLDHERALGALREEASGIRAELERDLAALQATERGLRDQLTAAAEQQREFAAKVDADRREREAQAKEESRIVSILTPVQESLRTMQGKVGELEEQRSRQHAVLSEQLRTAALSEQRLSATAEALAAALSNNAQRGVWGEAQLRSLVESAGLLNRVDFALQSSITAESGARRPDLIVRLPGGKSIPVDAKVPYDAYMDACAIPATATGDDARRRTDLLAKHAKQVKAHVDALASKQYWTGLDASPDFTIAFIPNEPLLAAALQQDPTLMEYAFGKRIALASPVSFWAVLKTVAFTWQQEVLTEEAKELFDLGKLLYTRLATLSKHADDLGASIAGSVKKYNQFAASLETRVLVTARKLDGLDESTVIGVPRVLDEQPKPLTAPELTERGDEAEPESADSERGAVERIRTELEAIAPPLLGADRAELELDLVDLEEEPDRRVG